MKKIYLKNNNGNLQASRIIDADNLSFVFNRVNGTVFATQTATAKTSEVKIIHHPNWKGLSTVEKYIFEIDVMDKLALALRHLYTGDNNMLEIDFDCSEVHVEYTFKIESFCPAYEDYTDVLTINIDE